MAVTFPSEEQYTPGHEELEPPVDVAEEEGRQMGEAEAAGVFLDDGLDNNNTGK